MTQAIAAVSFKENEKSLKESRLPGCVTLSMKSPEAPMSDPTRDLLATRWSLLRRLQGRDDQQSWQEFFDTYWRLIHSVALSEGHGSIG